MHQRGFTLVEVAVAAAIVTVMLCAAIAIGASRPTAAGGALQFDAAIAYARTLASGSGNGSTAVLVPQSSGFSITVYSGRPNASGALRASALEPVDIGASISEASLGAAPFTIFFDTSGYASAMRGSVSPSTVLASDPGCPGGKTALAFLLSDSRTTVARTLPCAQ